MTVNISRTDLGLNYWPHEDVVVKLDYQNQDGPTADGSYDGSKYRFRLPVLKLNVGMAGRNLLCHSPLFNCYKFI